MNENAIHPQFLNGPCFLYRNDQPEGTMRLVYTNPGLGLFIDKSPVTVDLNGRFTDILVDDVVVARVRTEDLYLNAEKVQPKYRYHILSSDTDAKAESGCYLRFSVAHISETTRKVLERSALSDGPFSDDNLIYRGISVYEKESYGWLLFLHGPVYGMEKLPEDLQRLVAAAEKRNCDLLILDRNEPADPELPVYLRGKSMW